MTGGGGSGGGSSPRPTPVTPISPRKGSGNGEGGGVDPCVLVEETTINSPVQAIVSRLVPSSVLSVELQQGPPVRVVLRTSAGQIAGSITGAKLPQIIECLAAGVAYKADVISVKGAAVRVRVSNV